MSIWIYRALGFRAQEFFRNFVLEALSISGFFGFDRAQDPRVSGRRGCTVIEALG